MGVWPASQDGEKQSEVMLLTLGSGHTGHGGKAGERNAIFLRRHGHADSPLCSQRRVTESNDMALTLHFPFPKCCGSFCFPPLPPCHASTVIALLKL